MANKNDDRWLANFEALRAHVQQHGHFPNKHTTLNNFCRYQRKRIKAGIMPPDQMAMFLELCQMRSNEHTGGRRKKTTINPTEQ